MLFLLQIQQPVIYDKNQKFEFGKGIQIGDGTDATVIATGICVSEAIIAQEQLQKEGINIRVVDILKWLSNTIKL